MKAKAIAILLIIALFTTGCARMARIKRISVRKIEIMKISAPKPTFTAGEKFTFVGAWKGISIGHATATIEDIISYKEYKVYKVVVIAKTNEFLSKLFPVEDTFISYVDTEEFTSRRYEAIRKEGNYRKHLVVEYDFDKLIATYTNLRDGTVKTSPIEKNVHDPISAAYYCRTIPVKIGDRIKITVNLNEENYEIIADIEKKASITLPKLGEFNAVFIRPFVKLHEKRQKRANTWGYISTGKDRMPLYGVVNVLEIPWIGEITGTLEKVKYISPS